MTQPGDEGYQGPLGHIPDPPDPRDHTYTAGETVALPDSVDLRALMPPVYQQEYGTCTAQSTRALIEHRLIMDGRGLDFRPNPYFLYWNGRSIMNGGPAGDDTGCAIRTIIKSVAQFGACHDTLWYSDDPGNTHPTVDPIHTQPDPACYADAVTFEAVEYQSVANGDLQAALAAGDPVVVGIPVYHEFDAAGWQPDHIAVSPDITGPIRGMHAVTVVGYKQVSGVLHYIIRNSWGPYWGDAGHCYMHENWLSVPNAFPGSTWLAGDFWVIKRLVGELPPAPPPAPPIPPHIRRLLEDSDMAQIISPDNRSMYLATTNGAEHLDMPTLTALLEAKLVPQTKVGDHVVVSQATVDTLVARKG